LGAMSSAMAAPTTIPLIKRPIMHLPFLHTILHGCVFVGSK
jgi:hypothetical protein